MKRLQQSTTVTSIPAGPQLISVGAVTITLTPETLTYLRLTTLEVFDSGGSAKLSLTGVNLQISGFQEQPKFANVAGEGPYTLPLTIPGTGLFFLFPDLLNSEWDIENFQQSLTLTAQAGVNNTDVAAHNVQTSLNVVYELAPLQGSAIAGSSRVRVR